MQRIFVGSLLNSLPHASKYATANGVDASTLASQGAGVSPAASRLAVLPKHSPDYYRLDSFSGMR